MLYHFTSAEGLIGIAQSEALFATDLAYLNDTEERWHGIRLFERVMDRAKGGLEGRQEEVLQGLLQQMKWAAEREAFIASFARQKSLAMYRTYCPSDGGYSLGIRGQRLDEMARVNGFLLHPCIYDPRVQEQICQELIDCFISNFKDHEAYCRNLNPPVVPAYSYRQQTANFANDVMMRCCLPLFKHQSFETENEWRLIADGPYRRVDDGNELLASDDERKGKEVEKRLFRKGMRGITPYVLFPLHRIRSPSFSEEYESSLMHCEVGPPATDQRLREAAVKRLFKPFEDVKVSSYESPYRA